MKTTVNIGDFGKFGARYIDGEVIFTYELSAVVSSAIILRKKINSKLAARIEVPDSFRRGRVVSVRVGGYDWDQLTYMIEENGEEHIDVYAPLICGREKWMNTSRFRHNYHIYGGFNSSFYEWKNKAPDIPAEDIILYKAHIRGITMNAGLPAEKKGNYLGVIDMLPRLKKLGITAIEFMPIYEFEELKYPSHLTYDDKNRRIKKVGEAYGVNYWGYGDGDYFSPKTSYFGGDDAVIHMCEMVDAIHGAGMEIYMEISAEASRVGEDVIIDMLRFWNENYRIDGFHLLGIDYPIERVVKDPYLADCKIFYENIPTECLFSEKGKKRLFITNDGFLYALRRIQNHFDGNAAELANMMRRQNESFGFVNYASNNIGFSLYDSYSYGEKHNEANGEENRDGQNYNCSTNHGVEGETKRREVLRARFTSMRTAFALLMTSQAIPMILSGDEVANTRYGNNNPYCQDNNVAWVRYRVSAAKERISDYLAALIRFRNAHPVLKSSYELKRNDHKSLGFPDLSYHGREHWIMGIGGEKKGIGILYNGDYSEGGSGEDVMLCINFYYGEETFALPKLPGDRKWYYISNTQEEVFGENERLCANQNECIVPGGTVSIFVGRALKPEKKNKGSKKANSKKTDNKKSGNKKES
ncbi:MAG: hypothetical protein J6N76_00860 [Lachnospiraceae bacterium]|nr:hypothetical protein [Lachnospiraceae bacterium]